MKSDNDKMTRGEASEFLGVTKNTLRNYENIGLIQPQKDTINNYRYFDVENVSKLIQIRRLRNLGFSLEEVDQILSCSTIREVNDLMWNSMQKLIEEQEALVKRVKDVSHLYSKIHKAMDSNDAIQIIEEKKKFYYQKRDLYKENDKKNWAQSNYKATTSGIITFSDYEEYSVETGMILKDEDKNDNFDESTANKIIEFNKAIYCVKPCYMISGNYVWKDYEPLIQYAKNNHLNYENKIITYGLIALKDEYKSTYFLELYLPLKDC